MEPLLRQKSMVCS